MTVEFVVAFPVVVVVAVIAVNAMLFFSECAAFDRVARDAVRVHAASPAYGQGLEQSRASVQAAIEEALAQPYTDVRVAVEGASLGHVTFTAHAGIPPHPVRHGHEVAGVRGVAAFLGACGRIHHRRLQAGGGDMRAKGRPPTQARRALCACAVVCALCVGACALDGPVSALGDVADAASWAQQAAWTQGAQQAAQAGGRRVPSAVVRRGAVFA